MKNHILLSLLLFSFYANSGDATNSTIDRVTVLGDVAYINTAPRPTNKAACATNQWWDYTFKINTDSGKATLSMALSAYVSKRNVTVRSLNTCTNIADMEDLQYLILERT